MDNRSVKTTCPYCGVGCGVVATTTAEGHVTITGDSEHPANFGRLCSKGAALAETLSLDGRLLQPQVNGKKSDWDSALDAVARGFKKVIDQHGPDAVAFYVSGQLLTEDYYVANKLMKGFIGSANIDTNSRLCMSSAVAAYKRALGTDTMPCSYDDLDRAKLIVITGSNVAWCHPVIYQRIVRVKANNPDLRVVVIDPRKTASCDIADLHLPLKPGSDAVLFNGLLNYLAEVEEGDEEFISRATEGADETLAEAKRTAPSIDSVAEQCQLDSDVLEQFYKLYARTERVITLFSQGINQSTSGTDKANAIINCHLYSGRIGRRGMGPFSITGQPNAMGGREVGGMATQLAAHMALENSEHRALVQQFWGAPVIADKQGLQAVELFRAIERGAIKAVWIMATNPVVSMPDADRVKRALQGCELVVISDVVEQGDSVDLAHIKLPAQAWGERSGTVTNSERRISRQRPFLSPPAGAKPDWWIVDQVARRLYPQSWSGYTAPHEIFTEHAQLTGHKNSGSRALDISGLIGQYGMGAEQYEQLRPIQWPVTAQNSHGTRRMFGDGRFFTQSGRAKLIPITPRAPDIKDDASYPFILNSGRVRDQWHTMTRSGKSVRLSSHSAEPYVDIHPDDAQSHGLQTGMLVSLKSPEGGVVVRAKISEAQRPGTLFVPMHWNDQFASNGRINRTIAARCDPLSGQPEFKQSGVNIGPFKAEWYGILLSRRQLQKQLKQGLSSYWSRSRGAGLWRYQLAGDSAVESWSLSARALLCADEDDVGWIEYFDQATKQYRAARMVDGKLESCLYIGPDQHLPEYEWLESLFAKEALNSEERIALLSGKPAVPVEDIGPVICACHGVGRKQIRDLIEKGQVTTVEEIGEALKAGTNCASCVPELRALLRS